MIGHLMLWFQPINFQFSHSHFEGSVDAEILTRSLQLIVPLHQPHHLHIPLPLKRSLFSSWWMKCGPSLCGRLSFSSSSSSSFMVSDFFFSTSAFHIRFRHHHLHPHHLSSILYLYLDTPTSHLLHCVLFYFQLHGWLLCSSVYVFIFGWYGFVVIIYVGCYGFALIDHYGLYGFPYAYGYFFY